MSILDQIVNRTNKGPIPVHTPEWPEWDGRMAVRRLTPAERIAFYELAASEKPAAGIEFLALIACHCAVYRGPEEEPGVAWSDAVTVRAFASNDWRALLADPGSGPAIERLAEAADDANVLSDNARESIKKKYEPATPSASTSASPAPPACP